MINLTPIIAPSMTLAFEGGTTAAPASLGAQTTQESFTDEDHTKGRQEVKSSNITEINRGVSTQPSYSKFYSNHLIKLWLKKIKVLNISEFQARSLFMTVENSSTKNKFRLYIFRRNKYKY